MEREAQGFLERCDDWLSTHEIGPVAAGTVIPIRLGAGVYAIQENPIGESS